MVRFTTVLMRVESGNATGIAVSPDLVAQLGGGKAPLVKVTFNGYPFRGKVAVYGGDFLIGFSAEHRQASGIGAGDSIDVTLELDTEVRTVEIPEDLAEALEAGGLLAAFQRLSPSHRKEHVRSITAAKAPETRARRIEKTIAALRLSG